MKPTTVFLTTVLLASPGLASGETLTIERAVQLAQRRAPEIAAARQAEARSAAIVKQARSAYLPRVDFEASYLARWPKNNLPIELPAIPGMPEISDVDDIHHVNMALKVGYRVFDLARGQRTAAASLGVDAARAGTRQRATEVAFETRATFLAALLARDLNRIAGESLRQAKRMEKRAKLRQEVGTGNRVALAQSRVRVATLSAQRRRAKIELVRQQRRLAQLIGRRRCPALQGDLAALARPPSRISIARSPLLARLKAARLAAERTAKSHSRTFIPTLSLFGSASLQYPRAFELELGPIVSGGVMLSWSIFDGLRRSGQVAASKARARQLAKQEQATRRALERKLIDVKASGDSAGADLRSAKEILTQQGVYLRVARAAVSTGTGTELDVHNAELGVDRARVAVQRALFDAAMACARAQLLLGQGEPGAPRAAKEKR